MNFIRTTAAVLLSAGLVVAQPQPPGTPFPDTTYPNATDPYDAPGAQSGQTSAPYYPSPWGEGAGDWASAYARARTFVSGLTLLEKVNLTTGVGWEGEKCVGNNGAIPRLNFKALCLEDSPLGVRDTDFNSAFPAGVTIAATWDRDLIYQRGQDMGMEHKLKGVDIQLGPVVGPLGRSPEGGRNWEGFSPDPVLSGIAVANTIQGMQSSGIMACTKHYILNEQEHFRQGGTNISDSISSNLDDVTMHELYLWPFADAVRAGTASVMCAYNQVNNSYNCQNSQTLNKLLKAELGFQGFVMSDWSGQHSGVSSALAGLDMTMPGDEGFDSGNSYWGSNLTIAVLNGTVPQWRLDDMCVRIMAAWYYVGRDQNQVENAPNFSAWTLDTFGYQHQAAMEDYTQVNYHVNVQGNHGQHIRNASARGTVLLKNTNGALPLSGKEMLTGVFGEDAGDNTLGPNGCSDRGCDNGTLAMGWGSGTANFPYLVTPLTAIQNEVLSNGADIEDVLDNYAYSTIETLAQRVDEVNGVCIVFANADAGEGYITVDGNEGDRNNLTLWGEGDTLIETVASYCNNTVVVMHTVGAVIVDSWYNNPNVTAIVWAGIPGQESGNSIADILYGRVNPSGKLPFTFGASRGDYGTDIIYQPNNGNGAPQDDFLEGPFIDYRTFDKLGETPIFEFGFGLSYTTFSYSNIQVQVNNSVPQYAATTGETTSAPTFGTIENSTAAYQFPAGFHQVPLYIYPYLNASTLAEASQDPQYAIPYTFPAGGYDSSPQPRLPASGPPGGNPGLYDILYTVTATVTNTGSVEGEEVPQLYVSLGGPNDPVNQLRQFDKINIQPGQSATFTAQLTRRDVSNWDTVSQDWVISSYPKTVHVGSSSRKLPLSAPLPAFAGTANATLPVAPYGNNTSSAGGVSVSSPVSASGSASGSATGSATGSASVSGSGLSGYGSSTASAGSASGSAGSATGTASNSAGSATGSNTGSASQSASGSGSGSASSPAQFSSSVVSAVSGYGSASVSSPAQTSAPASSSPSGYGSASASGSATSSAPSITVRPTETLGSAPLSSSGSASATSPATSPATSMSTMVTKIAGYTTTVTVPCTSGENGYEPVSGAMTTLISAYGSAA